MPASYTMGVESSGRELLVVVVKGTFHLPRPGEAVRLHDEQRPLVMADTFSGEPGRSAPVYEADFAPRKHRCDVLLRGSAYAPGGRPTAWVPVGLRVGSMQKSFAVVGDRVWQSGVAGVSASEAQPFAVMPFSYDCAFGGTDDRHEDPAKHAAFMRNPVGRGFHNELRREWIDGTPLPNTEELNRPVNRPDGDYAPMAFGPIGRGWEPRYRYAGTYDQRWLNDYFPSLPPDFDGMYYQATPLDQQTATPVAAGEIALLNLTSEGRVTFALPTFNAPIHFFPKRGGREDARLALDTIVIEPDLGRLMLTWRATRPLRRSMFEVAQILVGRKSPEWWSAREETSFPIQLLTITMRPNGPGNPE